MGIEKNEAEVNADLLIHVETAPTPEKDPDDERVWM